MEKFRWGAGLSNTSNRSRKSEGWEFTGVRVNCEWIESGNPAEPGGGRSCYEVLLYSDGSHRKGDTNRRSFADAESAEHAIEQIVGVDLAGDVPDGRRGGANLGSDEFVTRLQLCHVDCTANCEAGRGE